MKYSRRKLETYCYNRWMKAQKSKERYELFWLNMLERVGRDGNEKPGART